MADPSHNLAGISTKRKGLTVRQPLYPKFQAAQTAKSKLRCKAAHVAPATRSPVTKPGNDDRVCTLRGAVRIQPNKRDLHQAMSTTCVVYYY